MHIAFLIRSLEAGGAERATASLAEHMKNAGHKVSILCLTGTESFYPLSPEIDVRYLNMNDAYQQAGLKRITALLDRSRILHKIVAEVRPDVLVGMSWMMSVYAAICTKGTGTISVGTERSNPFILNESRINTALRRFAARHCTGFVCQTEKARSFYQKSCKKRIAVIPNGIFNPAVQDISVPESRKSVIAGLGRLDRNKGFDVLIRAFAELLDRHPEYTLRIFGEGESRAVLESLCDTLGLGNLVQLPGVDPHAIEKIAHSAVFVLSSRSEGMPNALMEAMAVGVPCVSARCEMGPQELIRDGYNGLLVPVDDAHAMASAIERILDNPRLAESLSAHALELRRTHDPARISEQWLDYFGTLF